MSVWKEILARAIPAGIPYNSGYEFLKRGTGLIMEKEVRITGTGVLQIPVFKVTGSVRVLNQWAIITEVTTLNNMTDVYADTWDGTTSVKLTKTPGAVLSGAPVGTFFTKDKDSTNIYSVSLANQVRVLEATNKIAVPFVVTQKNGADTFIRFNFTTTDSLIDFKMHVWFVYYPLNGGILEFV